ncbi:hypothetical protein GCM10023350_25790 [Nocardioides endophyticus]|uniref:Serine acetyltransferase n=1 Tax=Nocardioides endophyticus TaxID=1353775 RepID=A0ABP8YW77_9ACTN
MAYRVIVDWILGVEIPPGTNIGGGLRLHHAHGIVIHGATIIGRDVEIHQGVTLGARRTGSDCPTIGSRVKIGTGAIIIGAVTIGDDAKIGAGAVVISDVPARGIAVGNPARVIPPAD